MFGVVFFGRITRTKMHYCGDKVRKWYKPFGLICVVFAFCIGATAGASTTMEECCDRCVGGRELKILPSMSLQAVNDLDLKPGDRVLFARGGVWRGQLVPKSGERGRPIVYGAFGTGPKPVIEPSYAKDTEADWTDAGYGLWRAESGAREDIGNIIFDHGVAGCAFKRDRREHVKNDLDFWCDPDTRAVFLWSERNPATRFSSLELCEKIHAVRSSGGHDIELDGLWIRYSGAHGVGVTKVARFNVRNCDISWIGGGIQYGDDHGNGVRFGNGIEFWADAEDCTVERNRLWEIWDAALSNQSHRDGHVQRNIRWLKNEVWNSEYSFEYWQSSETSVTDCIIVKDNLFRDAGSGWGHRQRWNPNAAHLMLYDNCAKMTGGFIVEGNVFSRSKDTLMRLFNDWRGSMTFRDNIWRADGESLCRYHGRPVRGLKYLYPMRLDRAHDDNLAEIESQTVNSPRLFASNQLAEFMSFLNDDGDAARTSEDGRQGP